MKIGLYWTWSPTFALLARISRCCHLVFGSGATGSAPGRAEELAFLRSTKCCLCGGRRDRRDPEVVEEGLHAGAEGLVVADDEGLAAELAQVISGLAGRVAALPGHRLDPGGELGDGEAARCGGQGERG